MRKFALLFSIIGAGCMGGASTGTQTGTIMSCFDSSKHGGLACIDTPEGPETHAKDVDDDGTDDKFECADRDSDDDGTPDFEDEHDDDHDSKMTSGDRDGGSDDGDKDDDGIDDDEDCGTPPQPPV